MSDPDFLSLINATVAVEIDVYAGGSGSESDDRGENYQPVAGLEAVPCHVRIYHPKNAEIGDRGSTHLEWKVRFPESIALDRRHRLVYTDPDSGALRYGYVQGHSVNPHGLNHHWFVIAHENPI